MPITNCSAKLVVAGMLVAVSGALFSAPATAAELYRSFYQNAGGNCHGVANSNNDNKITRTEQSLQNNTTTLELDVVCNLMTDGYATYTPDLGTVAGVYLWARRVAVRGDNASMTCTMVSSFAGDPYTQSFTQTITLPGNTTDQAYFQWIPPTGQRFLAPINIRCLLPRKTELNDWLVEYVEDVGN